MTQGAVASREPRCSVASLMPLSSTPPAMVACCRELVAMADETVGGRLMAVAARRVIKGQDACPSGAAGRRPVRLPAGSHRTVQDRGGRSVAASLLVWGAAPAMACGWGVTSPCRVAQACVNSAPKNRIRAE